MKLKGVKGILFTILLLSNMSMIMNSVVSAATDTTEFFVVRPAWAITRR